MKKSILFLALAATISFTSCSNDNDDNVCESCTAQEQKVEICDNGDGTYTLTVDGEPQTINESELDGLTPKQVVEATCEALNLLPSLEL